MSETTTTFVFHPDGTVTNRTHSTEGKCSIEAAAIRDALGSQFAFGTPQKVTSDRVKDEKVVANVANRN